MTEDTLPVTQLHPSVLEPITGTALFYPCCGDDLQLPIDLFGHALADFYFADTRTPRWRRLARVERDPSWTETLAQWHATAKRVAHRVHRLQA